MYLLELVLLDVYIGGDWVMNEVDIQCKASIAQYIEHLFLTQQKVKGFDFFSIDFDQICLTFIHL